MGRRIDGIGNRSGLELSGQMTNDQSVKNWLVIGSWCLVIPRSGYGFGGEVQISTISISVPVFSMPWRHHGGRYTKLPFFTSRISRAKVIVPRPSRMT